MFTKIVSFCVLLAFSINIAAMPNISIKHIKSIDGYSKIMVTNKTVKRLDCYVAIDGYKIKFSLNGKQSSQWYKATDKKFTAANFSARCDYTPPH